MKMKAFKRLVEVIVLVILAAALITICYMRTKASNETPTSAEIVPVEEEIQPVVTVVPQIEEVVDVAEDVQVDYEPVTLKSESTVVPEPTPEPTPEPEPEPEPTYNYDEAVYVAKTIYGEGNSLSPMEKAAIAWCICNRVDSESTFFPDSVIEVVTQHMQFHGYKDHHPVTDENLEIAIDVLTRWAEEKAGVEEVGRVLPKEWCYFYGDLKHNYYTVEYQGSHLWDWSLPNPYENVEEVHD